MFASNNRIWRLLLKKCPDLASERFGANKRCFSILHYLNLTFEREMENMLFIKLFSQDLPRGFGGMFAIFTWNSEDVLRVGWKWIWSKINLNLIKVRLHFISERIFPNTNVYPKIQKTFNILLIFIVQWANSWLNSAQLLMHFYLHFFWNGNFVLIFFIREITDYTDHVSLFFSTVYIA